MLLPLWFVIWINSEDIVKWNRVKIVRKIPPGPQKLPRPLYQQTQGKHFWHLYLKKASTKILE